MQKIGTNLIIPHAPVIGFPVWILWGVRISLRKKLALGAIFSLVGFTIVATVLRGALLSEVFTATTAGKTFNIPWVWFWFHIEFCTGKSYSSTLALATQARMHASHGH